MSESKRCVISCKIPKIRTNSLAEARNIRYFILDFFDNDLNIDKKTINIKIAKSKSDKETEDDKIERKWA